MNLRTQVGVSPESPALPVEGYRIPPRDSTPLILVLAQHASNDITNTAGHYLHIVA
jgi:hypothetical protein